MEEKDWTGLLDILSVKALKLDLGGDEALAIATQSAAISKIALESLGIALGARAFVQEWSLSCQLDLRLRPQQPRCH